MSNLPAVIEKADEASIDVKIIYNIFEPDNATIDKIDWRVDATLSDYLEGLPEDVHWLIAINGDEIDPEERASDTLQPGDRLTLVVLPEGGKTFKTILRMVATIATFIVLTPVLGPAGAAIAAAVVNAAFMVAANLMRPKQKTQPASENTYGVDGAKNSAVENIPVPVIYGEFRYAGNFSDLYTENVGDTQYLYMRSILNDGPIEGVYDIELNEQPIANFSNVETLIHYGTLNQQPNPWFRSSIRQINKAQKITTNWLTHNTTDEIEQARFDIVFPRGLVDIDQKKGKYRNRSVTFQIEHRLVGNAGWGLLEVPIEETQTIPTAPPAMILPAGPANGFAVGGLIGLAQAMALAATNTPVVIQSRPATGGAWTVQRSIPAGELIENESTPITTPGGFNSGQYIAIESGYMDFAAEPGDVEIAITGGATINTVTTFTSSGQFTVTDNRTSAIRRSFLCAELPRGLYELRIRRTTPESTNEYIVDEVHLTDIAEIEHEEIALVGKATLSLRIKLNDQLSSIPNVTARVKGSLLRQYDSQGNITGTTWSNNPAWVEADIKCGPERGAGIPTSRIDWPRIVEFAKYCEDNGITYNGVFDNETNMHDASVDVLRIGHSAPITIGTKYSLTTDSPRDPVQAFNSSNMVKGSLNVGYISFADRANEFEARYYDKTDRNKEKTIRYVDPKAVQFNETQKSFTLDLRGVDTADRANKELWRAIYANRLLVRTARFEAYTDAISCSLGDLVLLQTDRLDWSEGGLLESGSTVSAIKADKELLMEPGFNYAMIVQHDAVKLTQKVINSVVGSRVFVPKLLPEQKPKRMIVGTKDYEILEITRGASLDTIVLDEVPTAGTVAGATAHFWDTDVLEERNVASVTQSGGLTTVNLATPLTIAPTQHSRYIFGKTTELVRPFTVIGIDGEGVDKRSLTCIEYREEIYGPPEVEVGIPIAPARNRTVAQVSSLLVDYDTFVKRNQTTANVRVHWNATHIWNYGGADVYARINGSNWRLMGATQGGSEFALLANIADDLQIRVVAFSRKMDRAPFDFAPITTVDLDGIPYTEEGLAPTYLTGETIDALQPAEPNATYGAPTGSPIAGVPAETVISNIADLTTTYGSTASAAASASIATAAQIAAQAASAAAAADEALAEAHRTAAETAATSANGSASTASGQATIATNAASAAANSQSIAAGHASTATTQAGIATTQAAGATASASTALTQSNLSATYAANSLNSLRATKPRGMSGGVDWYTGSAGWTFGLDGSIPVINATSGAAMDVYPKWAYVATPGRTYRLHIEARAASGTRSISFARGDVNTEVAPSAAFTAGIGSAMTFGTSYSVQTRDYQIAASPPSPYIFAFFNISAGASQIFIKDFWVEDITPLIDAGTQASIATTQAATATSQAAIAAANAALSASITPNARNKDPYMTLWNNTTTPTHWLVWNTGTPNRTAGFQAQYSNNQPIGAGVQTGLYQVIPMSPGWWVEEMEVTLNSGTLRGVGIHTHTELGGVATGDFSVHDFWSRHGDGVAGRTYRIGVIRQYTANCNGAKHYAMIHYAGLPSTGGDVSAANDITIRYCGIRPATEMEIRDKTALAPLEATVTSQQSAIVDAAAKLAEARLRLRTAASGGNPAVFEMYSATGATSFIALGADQILFGANTVFDDATDTLTTTVGSDMVNCIAWGAPFGSDSLLQWVGPTGVALASRTKANAYFYLSTSVPRMGGSALQSATTSTVTVGYGQTIRKLVPNGGTVSLSGGLGLNAGGNAGTARAQIQSSEAGANSWTTVVQSAAFSVGPGEPGADVVSGTFQNTSGVAKVYEFRIFESRTPGTAGGTINGSQTYLTG